MTTDNLPLEVTAADDESPPNDGRIRFFRALIYPFFDKPWHWLLNLTLITLLQYVPFLGLIVIQGWSLEVSRRVKDGKAQALPQWSSFGDYLKGWWGCVLSGLALWLIWLVVYEIPGIVLTVILFVKFALEMVGTGYTMYQSMNSSEPMPAMTADMAFTWGSNWVVAFVIEKCIVLLLSLGIILVGHVMYCGGMIRYLNSGSWWCFFQPLKNLWLVLCHLRAFSVLLFYWLVLQTVLWVLGLLMASLGVSSFFIPIVIPIGFWFVGHLYGQVALKVASQS